MVWSYKLHQALTLSLLVPPFSIINFCFGQEECPLSLQTEFTISYHEIDLSEELKLNTKKSYYKGTMKQLVYKGSNNAQDYLIRQTFNNDNFPQPAKRLVVQQVPTHFVQQQLNSLGSQFQQQQEVFQANIMDSQESLPSSANDSKSVPQNTTESVPEPEILIKWFLNIPRGSVTVRGARLGAHGGIVPEDVFLYDVEQLKDNNATVFSSNQMVVDMSEFDWVPYSWYLLCTKQQYVVNGNLMECQHCGLVKSEGPSQDEFGDFPFDDNEKVLSVEVMKEELTAVSATVQVNVYDLPISRGAAVTIKAIPLSEDERCKPVGSRIDSRYTDPIYPNTVTIRTLTSLDPATAYRVDVDLILPLSEQDGSTMGLKTQTLVIQGYSQSSTSSYQKSIPKCD